MGYKVEVYIYDLSQGLARSIGPALIGRPLDGIWHTSVVVYGREYYFGSAGIESCNPGGTMLGQPLKVEDLGHTEIPPEVFNEYLMTHSQDRFKGEKYDLLRHNCNIFSSETATFLTGSGIPQYILDLPNEVLSTPLGQMLAPMLQQMTPQGNSIPFTMGNALERTGWSGLPNENNSTSTTRLASTGGANAKPTRVFPVQSSILLDNPVNVEGIMRKVTEFNAKETENQLSENEIKVFGGVVKGLVRLSKDSLSTVLKVASWREEHRFPALDLLRHKFVRWSTIDVQLEDVVDVLVKNLDSSDVNAMLAVAALANLIANPDHHRHIVMETVIEKMTSRLPSSHKKLEINIITFLHNLTVHGTNNNSVNGEVKLEQHILILSTILTNLHSSVQQTESHERLLISLGNILHTGHQEVLDLAHGMDVHEYIKKVEPSCNPATVREVKDMLKISMNGIDLE